MTWDPLTKDLSILIQIFRLLQILETWSLWNFAYGTTAVLSRHMQNALAIDCTRLLGHFWPST